MAQNKHIREQRALRESLYLRLEDIATVAASFQTEPENHTVRRMLEVRSESVKNIYDDILKIHGDIVMKVATLPDSNLDEEHAFLKRVDETYFTIQSIVRELPVQFRSSAQSPVADKTSIVQTSKTRLPKLNLQTFDGKLENWSAFIQVFNRSIHDNNTLANVERFEYLLGCLSVCEKDHIIYRCPVLKAKSPVDRFKVVKEKRLCINCLRPHQVKNCSSTSTCRTCHKNHHTLLHFDRFSGSSGAINETSDSGNTAPAEIVVPTVNALASSLSRQVALLSTALVDVHDSQGHPHTLRVLIDNGSEASFITFYSWDHINNLKLADPNFYISRHVDLLLGADVYAQLIRPGLVLAPSPRCPSAFNTIFGWAGEKFLKPLEAPSEENKQEAEKKDDSGPKAADWRFGPAQI
ncbi:hypothetical protein NQ318_001565 [Aromia moschata]|uniref:Peptidase aspartic putative domain-containing protein n=1 Tax=Aromia moschata TaxID=1265417 RepID=A0AAV8XAU4_9CUCU|nr:hypothetical protein NQ318_001565 [Aromia moschata]